LLREEEKENSSRAINITNMPNIAVGNPNSLSLEHNYNNTCIALNQNSKSFSNEEESELSDDNSTLINFKKFNINNIKEIRDFESNSFRNIINNKINKNSLVKGGQLNISNTAENIINKNSNPLSNKLFKDDFQMKNTSTQREKRKISKFSSIFSDIFSSNNEKKNSNLDYNSFRLQRLFSIKNTSKMKKSFRLLKKIIAT